MAGIGFDRTRLKVVAEPVLAAIRELGRSTRYGT